MLLGDGMARAYSSDLRVRVIRAVEGGFSARGAGRRLGIGESTATAWVGRWRRTGSAEAKSQKGRSRSPLKAHTAWLLALIGERADLTLEEIRELLGERGVGVGVSSIWRFFDRHGISFKKNRARRGAAARRRGPRSTRGQQVVTCIAVAAAVIEALDALDLRYPTVSEEKLKELAAAKQALIGDKKRPTKKSAGNGV